MAQELSHLVNRQQGYLFGYDGSWPEDDKEKLKGEVEIEDIISLLDLLLLCEIVAFCLLAYDVNS